MGRSSSELEINEGLYVARFDLDDHPNEEDDEKGFDEERALGDERLCLVGEGFGHEVEHVAKQHEGTDGFVGGAPLEENLRLELMENLHEDLLGNAKGGSTEKHPTSGYEVEGDDAAHQPTRWAFFSLRIVLAGKARKRAEFGTERVPDFVEAKEDAVDASPKDEVEGCPMPKTTQEHGHEEVEVLAELAVTVAAKGDVEVVLEPRGEADVPTAPKLGDGGGLVGAVEVLGELESEQEGNADCHVGVTRKVAIDLERVAIDGKEVFESAVEVGLVEDALYEVDADVVADDGFLEKSSDDVENTRAEHGICDHERTTNLWDEVTCPDNRTRHKLREETDVESIVEQAIERFDVAPIDIDGVTQRLEREERDAHGQEDVARLPRHTLQVTAANGRWHMNAIVLKQGADGVAEEVGVLEEYKQAEVENEGKNDEGFGKPSFLFHRTYRLGNEVVGGGDECQQPEEESAGLIVKIVGKEGDEEDAEGICLAKAIVYECEAQKEEQKDARRENHRRIRLIEQLFYEA